MIKIKNLRKSYNNIEVLNIDALHIDSQSIFGLVGNNGAGKTTLLRSVLDLIKIDSGEVFISDIPVNKNEKWKMFTGSYLDESFLIDYLTPVEYLNIVGKIYNMSENDISDNLIQLNALWDSESNEKKYIRELSSGNKKKVGLVSAMFINPKLLILDEPHANLDPRSQLVLKEYLLKLNKYKGTTIIVSSHNLNFASEICDRILLLEEGKAVGDEKVTENTLSELNKYFGNQVVSGNIAG